MSRLAVRRRVVRWRDGIADAGPDELAAEEPMEIRVNGAGLTITMRTPGHDFDLAVGFLVGEGVISSPDDLGEVRYCAGIGEDRLNSYNIVDVTLAPGVPAPTADVTRNVYTTSSCGLCGKASLDAVRTQSRWDVAGDPVPITPEVIGALPERLRAVQRTFERTGGLHAAALFTADGGLIAAREDVGRHNAVDKVIGDALLAGRLPARGTVLMVSGRASFELVQKAVMAGIPVLAAVSAPSSLAADLAEDQGLTLVGFVRGTSMNVYSGAHRIQPT